MGDGAGFVRGLVRIGPHAGAHRVAVRAGLSVGVPLLVLLATGHLDWAIYAAFGGFTALYGRNHVHLSRLQMQTGAAAMLTASVLLGVLVGLSDQRSWLAVPVAALLAALGATVSDVQDWHPPGPLFLIFGFAAVASVPSSAADLPIALGVAGGTAAFAILLGFAGSWWRARRGHRTVRTDFQPIHWSAATVRHPLRAGVSVLIAGAIATAAGIGHPYWAMVSAVVPLAASTLRPQLTRGVNRIVGTGLGLLVAWALLSLPLSDLALVSVVIGLQVTAELLIGRNYAIALMAITPLALLMINLVHPLPTRTLLTDRAVETVIGVAIGVLVGYLTRDRHTVDASARTR